MVYTYNTEDYLSETKRFVNNVYKTFKKHKIVRSQEQFSEQILKRSSHYLSMILASEQELSTASLSHLVKCIRGLKEQNKDKASTLKSIERLEETGLKVLHHKIKSIHIPEMEIVVL